MKYRCRRKKSTQHSSPSLQQIPTQPTLFPVSIACRIIKVFIYSLQIPDTTLIPHLATLTQSSRCITSTSSFPKLNHHRFQLTCSYRNLLIAALAIAAPLSLALPLAEPEPAKGAPATTKLPENQNIYAKPTWLSIPIIDPTKLSIFPTPAPTQKPEPVTTKGEQQDGQDHATKTVKGSEGGPAQSSQISATHAPEKPEAKGKGKGKGKGQRDVEQLENRDVEDLDLDLEIEGRFVGMRVELEGRAESGKSTGGFTRKPDPAPAPTTTAKQTQNFTGHPDTERAQTATAKPTQHFGGKPDGPEPTATGKPTQHFTEKPDTPPTKTIKTMEPVNTSIVFTDKPEEDPRTFTTMYINGGQATPSSVLVNSYGPVSSSAVVVPVPIGTGKPAGGRGS